MAGYIGIMIDMRPHLALADTADFEFGLCLSAGPVSDGGTQPNSWPPQMKTALFDLYCPWIKDAWPWDDDHLAAPTETKMGWGVWVQHMERPAKWVRLPSECCRLATRPTDNNHQAAYDSYNGSLSAEISQLKLVATNAWRPCADSKSFERLWGNAQIPETDDKNLPEAKGITGEPGNDIVSTDALMVYLARRAIARPPYNYGARLAWHLTLAQAELTAAIQPYIQQHGWPDTDRSKLRFCAFPYRQTTGVNLAPATLPSVALAGLERQDSTGGTTPVAFLVKTACNIVAAPTVASSTGSGETVAAELSPWRSQLVPRLARFLDTPHLILGLASEDGGGGQKRWQTWAAQMPLPDPPDSVTRERILLHRLWQWIVASSADLYTASALGGAHSFWKRCSPLPVPAAVIEKNRDSVSNWLEFLASTPESQDAEAAPAMAALGDLQLLISHARARIDPEFLTMPATQAESSMREELDKMAQFVNHAHSVDLVAHILPRLWQDAGVDPTILKTLGTLLSGNRRDEIGEIPDDVAKERRALAGRRLAENLVWRIPELLADRDSKADAAQELLDRLSGDSGLAKLVVDRSQSPIPPGAELRPAALPDLGAQFLTDVAAFPATRRDWLTGDESVPLREPHGITLPVAAERKVTLGHEISNDDALQAEAGHLVFAKREGGIWCCLNQAQLVLDPTANPGPTPLSVPLAVPLDLAFAEAPSSFGSTESLEDGFLQTTVLYDNQPLAARSRRADLVVNPLHQPDGQTTDGAAELPGSGYVFPKESNHPGMHLGRLPGLVYGHSYRFASLALTNAGVLPGALRAGTHPAVMNFAGLGTTDIPRIPGVVSYQLGTDALIPYLRRVGIAAPRIRAPAHAPVGGWPAIPSDVTPLAAEVEPVEKGTPEEPIAVLFRDPPQGSARTGAISKLHLEVRKPAADVENWDRWVAKTLPPAERAPVWARVFHERDKAAPTEQKEAPDDPSVGDYVLVRLEELYPGPKITYYAVAYRSGSAGDIQAFQKRPVDMVFEAVEKEEKVAVSPGEIRLPITDGKVVRVSVYNLVNMDLLEGGSDQRMDAKVFPPQNLEDQFSNFACLGEVAVAGALKSWRACSSHTFRVEVASRVLPTSKQLWDALEPEISGDRVLLSLSYPPAPHGLAFVSRLDLKQQIWRWNGRPAETGTADLPVSGLRDDDLMTWDGVGFHAREDFQHRVTVERLHYRKETLSPPPKALLLTEDRSSDHRALYYRFGLTVYSRYYGVLKNSESARRIVSDTPDSWRRCLLPARMRQRLKRPLVRAVVPITASDNRPRVHPALNPAASPGFIFMLAEPFYQQAGIAEDLECEIVVGYIDLPDPENPKTRDYYLQAGFDPVISSKRLSKIETRDDAPQSILRLHPPVGLTFDVGASDPEIVSTCFFGEIPVELAGFQPKERYREASAANTFFQLRVRRVLRPNAVQLTSEMTVKEKQAAVDLLASEWSESEWVRLLPDALALLLAWPAETNGHRRLSHLGNISAEIDGWHDPVPWTLDDAAKFEPKRFSYAVLLSRLVPDISGRLREIYACALLQNSKGQFVVCDSTLPKDPKLPNPNSWPAGLEDGAPCQGRIVELFHREPIPDGTGLWDALFPAPVVNQPAPDVIARIERISPPFPVEIS
jgi:hypothetical protein